ncbi:hypothetical protein AURDEDRAFT_124512 [Auricularia subglabra TFB-10046 SS5]|nr:hypothetical protein AURDEDRAFT_124512 [Auricularia subglabra TFB-10046 SS5]
MAQVKVPNDTFLADLSTKLHLTRLVRKFVGPVEVNRATGDVFNPFAALRTMTRLVYLDMNVPRVPSSESAATALAAMESLRSLTLRTAQNHPRNTEVLVDLVQGLSPSTALRYLSIRTLGEVTSTIRVNLHQAAVSSSRLVDALLSLLQASSNTLTSLTLSINVSEWEKLHRELENVPIGCEGVSIFQGRQFSTGMARSFPNLEELSIEISELSFKVLFRSDLLPKLHVLTLELPEKVLAQSLAGIGLNRRTVSHLSLLVPNNDAETAPFVDSAAASERIFSYIPLFQLSMLRSLYLGVIPCRAVQILIPRLDPCVRLRYLGLRVLPRVTSPGDGLFGDERDDECEPCSWLRIVLQSVLEGPLPINLIYFSLRRKGWATSRMVKREREAFGPMLCSPGENQHLRVIQFHTRYGTWTWHRASEGPFQFSAVDIIPRQPGFQNITRWLDAQPL